MTTAIWIAAGGAAGTLARYGMAGTINASGHPWGTVVVNLTGSLALGLLIGFWGFDHVDDHQLAVTIGFLGGFTTFSTFALDTVAILQDGRASLAVLSVVVSVFGSLILVIVGLLVGRAWSG